MSQRLYQCHGCHHVSNCDPCEHCGSTDTAIKQLHPETEIFKIGKRVVEQSSHIIDTVDLTTNRYDFRLQAGFAMLRSYSD
jgi:hypothetical protein